MKIFKNLFYISLVFGVISVVSVFGQGGNSISGHVFGPQRLPLEGITVDLLDDFSRTISRVRTDSTGRFFFSRMPSGRYRIRVLPLGTNYQEQEQEVEIQNMFRTDSNGERVATAFDNAQRDFYLLIDKNAEPLVMETIFAQSVPEKAQQLYDQGVSALKEKKTAEGYAKLKSAIEAFPEYYMAIERLGLEYIDAKHFAAAQILLQRAVEINPKSFKGWYGVAYSLYSLNLYADALKAAQNAVQIAPTSVDALLLIGILQRHTNNFEESEKNLVKAKKLTKRPVPEVFWQLALLYGNNLHRYKEAADELELFLKSLPVDSKDNEKIKALIKTFRDKAKQA